MANQRPCTLEDHVGCCVVSVHVRYYAGCSASAPSTSAGRTLDHRGAQRTLRLALLRKRLFRGRERTPARRPRSWNEQAPRAPAPRPPRAARARPRPPRGTARPRSMGPPPAPRPRQAPRARPRPPRGAARPPHILLPMFLGPHLLIFSQAAFATAAASAGIVARGCSAILSATWLHAPRPSPRWRGGVGWGGWGGVGNEEKRTKQ